MIGRGAQGNPWIFRELVHFLDFGICLQPPSAIEVHRVLSSHLIALHDFYGEYQGLRVARKHIGWYLQDRVGGRELRRQLMRVESAEQQLVLIDQYFNYADSMAA